MSIGEYVIIAGFIIAVCVAIYETYRDWNDKDVVAEEICLYWLRIFIFPVILLVFPIISLIIWTLKKLRGEIE